MGFLFVLACQKAEPIPLKKMSEILLKMHIAEGYAQVMPKGENSTAFKNLDSLLMYDSMILKEYKISKQQFQASIQYYKKKPELLDSIYQIMLSEVAVLQAKNNKK